MLTGSLIIHASRKEYLKETIDNIVDNTDLANISIIIAVAGDFEFIDDRVITMKCPKMGRSKAFNDAIISRKADFNILMRSPCKVSHDWLNKLLQSSKLHPLSLITPIVHTLDSTYWSSETSRYKSTTIGLDLNLHERPNNGITTAIVTSYCMLITRQLYNAIGPFDEEIEEGYGEDVEYSLRNLAAGNTNIINNNVSISSEFSVERSSAMTRNKVRICERWLKYRSDKIYDYLKVDADKINVGKLPPIPDYYLNSRHLIERHFSHLGEFFDLHNIAHGKTLAIVAPGVSLDYVSISDIMRSDLIVGVDGAALIINCDYVYTDSVQMIARLQEKYQNDKLLLPDVVENRMTGEYVCTDEILRNKFRFERNRKGIKPSDVYPPFCNMNDATLTAIHIALFMGPRKIIVYGFDTHLVGGKSHTDRCDMYGDGKLLPDTESTQKHFAYAELGASYLSMIAVRVGIPITKVSHL